METGPIGHHGELVVLLVEEEIKHKQEVAVIQHQQMVGKTAVPLIWKQQPRLAIASHALLVNFKL